MHKCSSSGVLPSIGADLTVSGAPIATSTPASAKEEFQNLIPQALPEQFDDFVLNVLVGEDEFGNKLCLYLLLF